MSKTSLQPNVIRGAQVNFSTAIGGSPVTYTAVYTLTVPNEFGTPFMLSLSAYNNSADSFSFVQCNGASVVANTSFRLYRNGVHLYTYDHAVILSSTNNASYIPPSSMQFIDHSPPIGTHTYTIDLFASNNGAGSTHQVPNTCLQAIEIK